MNYGGFFFEGRETDIGKGSGSYHSWREAGRLWAEPHVLAAAETMQADFRLAENCYGSEIIRP